MPTFHQDMGPIEENNHEKKIARRHNEVTSHIDKSTTKQYLLSFCIKESNILLSSTLGSTILVTQLKIISKGIKLIARTSPPVTQ